MTKIKFGALALIGLLSGCGTIKYDNELNMGPRQWVVYVSEKHSGWPPQVHNYRTSEGESIDVQARSTRGAGSFQESMIDFCKKTGGIDGAGRPGTYYCYNHSGPTYLYGLRETGNISSPQGPSYFVNLNELDRSNAEAAVSFYRKVDALSMTLPSEGKEEFEKYSAKVAQENEQKKLSTVNTSSNVTNNKPIKKIDLSWIKVGVEVCTDLVTGVRLEGTVEQLAGERVKVFIEDAYFISNPSFVPGGFKQRYDWMKNTEIHKCN
jgi:hypothetical protein